jgi:hypothetical protein
MPHEHLEPRHPDLHRPEPFHPGPHPEPFHPGPDPFIPVPEPFIPVPIAYTVYCPKCNAPNIVESIRANDMLQTICSNCRSPLIVEIIEHIAAVRLIEG